MVPDRGAGNQATETLDHKHHIKKHLLDTRCFFIWWPEADSNCRHEDFQSTALPTELSGHI